MNIYVYVMDTLADWELGNVTAELHSRRFFKKDAPEFTMKTVACDLEPVKSMGGMTIVPDCTMDDMVIAKDSVLILPGADTWSDPKHYAILGKVNELLAVGGTVCAICGATVALANVGVLDNRPHTSNGPGFLDMFAPAYKGKEFYVDEPAIADDNLITASCTGALSWAGKIIERLGVFQEDTMEAWFAYFSEGRPEQFYALMQTLPPRE